MGFFRNISSTISGIDREIKTHINTAFDYILLSVSKRELIKCHKENQMRLLDFTYNIAADVWLNKYPDKRDAKYNKRVMLLVFDILNKMGLKTNIDVSTPDAAEMEDLGLGMNGHQYMFYLYEGNEKSALECLDSTIDSIIHRDKILKERADESLIEQDLHDEPKFKAWSIVASIVATLVLLYILN